MCRKPTPIPFLLICCTTLFSCTRQAVTPHFTESVIDSALALSNQGKARDAIALVDNHYTTFPYISAIDQFRYYRFRHDLCNAYYSPAYDPITALRYADSMVWVLKKKDLTARLPGEYAMACNLQGQLYVEFKRYPEAIMAFSLCRLLAEKAGDSCLVAKYNATMATIRFRQAQYPEAIGLYKRALGEEKGCSADATEYHDMQGNLANIALAYTRNGQTDSALAYYQAAVNYIVDKRYLYTTDSIFPAIALGVVYGNQALAAEAAGDFATAETLLKKGIAINTLPGRDSNTGVIEQIHLAQLYLQTNRNAEAFALLRQTANHLPPDDDGTRKLWLTLMWKYDELTGNDRQAIDYLMSTVQLGDSMALKDRYRYTTNQDNVYQLFEDRNTIDLLQKSNTIRGMSLIIGGMLFFMAVTFTVLIRRNLKRHKRMLAELTGKSQAIVRQQEQLEQLLTALDQKNKEKDRILRVVAHDLRSPIGGIKMMAGMILGQDERRQAEMLGFIRNGAGNCLDLVNELLDESFNNASVGLDRSVFDLKTLMAECVQLMQFNAAEKDQLIRMTLPEEKQPVFADAGKMGRVINNLLGNAVKFSDQGSEILLSLSRNDQYYRITIRDHGIGIPIADQHRVFDTFTLSRRPGTKGERSFGFGLSISRQIVAAHGGRISFSSQEGQGTEFFVDLPRP
jgi:signal transduction histidine kinase